MTNEEKLEMKKAYTELDEILRKMSMAERNKIPKELIINIKREKDYNYIFNYDSSKDLLQQILKPETKALLVELYKKYLAPEEEKEMWKEYDKICFRIIEEEKKRNYISKYRKIIGVDLFEKKTNYYIIYVTVIRWKDKYR